MSGLVVSAVGLSSCRRLLDDLLLIVTMVSIIFSHRQHGTTHLGVIFIVRAARTARRPELLHVLDVHDVFDARVVRRRLSLIAVQ